MAEMPLNNASVDHGGLSYEIVVLDRFADNLQRFITQVDNATGAMARFKSAAGGFALPKQDTSAAQQARGVRQLADAETEGLTRMQKARLRYADALRAQRRAQEDAVVAQQDMFRLADRTNTRPQNQLAAHKAITREYNKQSEAATTLNLADQKGVKFTDSMLQIRKRIQRVMGDEAKLQKTLLDLQQQGFTRWGKLTEEQAVGMGLAEKLPAQRAPQVPKEEQAAKAAQLAIERNINAVLGDRTKTQATINTLQQRGVALNTLSIQQVKALERRVPGISAEWQKSLTFWQRLHTGIKSTDTAANRVSFTFRRLIGIMAAFTIFRKTLAGFVAILKEMVNFNARLEQAELGVASLLTAVGQVRSPFGDLVSAGHSLTLAIGSAHQQLVLLRRDALETTSTFDDLVQAFQTAIGPGLTAGLNIDQIREFTVRISQAATAIGLAQNQLAEEIRSLLQGTITPRATRIATALGITNEQIRSAKESGVLFEFLQRRFAAFEIAGRKASETFTGLFIKVKNAISLVLGEGGKAAFENFKNLFRDLFDTLTNRDEFGKLTPAPEAVAAVKVLGKALAEVVEEAHRLTTALGLTDLTSAASALATIVSGIIKFLGAAVEGILRGFGIISKVLQGIQAGLNFLGSIPGLSLLVPSLAKLVTVLTALLTLALSTRLAWLLLNKATLSLASKGLAAAIAGFKSLYTVIKAEGILYAVRALIGGFQALVIAINVSVIGALGKLTVALAALKAAFLAHPIGWILLAASLAAAAVYFAKTWLFADKTTKSLKNQEAAVYSLKDVYDDLPNVLIDSQKAMDLLDEKMEKINDRIAEVKDDLFKVSRTSNLSGPALDIGNIAVDAEIEQRKQMESLDRNRLELEQQRVNLGKQEIINRARISALSANELARINFLVDSARERAKTLEKIANLTSEITLAQTQENQARLEGNGILAASLQAKRELLEKEMGTRDRLLREGDVLEANQKITESQKQLVTDIIALEGNRKALGEAEIVQAEAQIKLQRELTHIRNLQYLASVKASQFQLQQDLARAQADRDAAVRTNEADLASKRVAGFPMTAQRLADALNEVEIMRVELDLLEQKQEFNRQEYVDRLAVLQTERAGLLAKRWQLDLDAKSTDNAKERQKIEEQIAANQDSINALTDQQLTSEKLITAELEKQRAIKEAAERRAERAEIAATGSPVDVMREGTQQAFEDMNSQLLDSFELTVKIMKEMTLGLADTISDAIVDAFDPTSDTSLKERFAAFLRDIGSMIIHELMRIMIVKAMLGLMNVFSSGMGGAAGAASSAGSGGSASAGIFGSGGAGLFSHDGGPVIGLAGGGIAPRIAYSRPRGLPPSDTVPIWATPGEWVIRARSAAAYGSQVMQAINDGLVDPLSLKALAGVRTRRSAPVSVRAGRQSFAEGGSIGSGATSRGSPAVAVIAPTPQAFKRLLDGGREEMIEFLTRNGFSRR